MFSLIIPKKWATRVHSECLPSSKGGIKPRCGDAAWHRETGIAEGNQKAMNECKSVLRLGHIEIQVYTGKGSRTCHPKICLSGIQITLGWFFFNLFIYFWLCWVFVSVRGLSPVVASGGHSSLQCAGLSLSRRLIIFKQQQTQEELWEPSSRSYLL